VRVCADTLTLNNK